MTHRVYTKLWYPQWIYGSGIWGTQQFSCISSVQNRACKILQLEDIWYGRRASQNSVSTSVDWCRLLRTDESRNSYTILKWISRRRKGWISIVEKAVNKLNVRDVIHNISIATQFAMRTVKWSTIRAFWWQKKCKK